MSNKITTIADVPGALPPASSSGSKATYVYISNADDGDISAYELRAASNAGSGVASQANLNPIGRTAVGKLVMPMVATPDGKTLYAAVRSAPFSIHCFQINPLDGGLELLAATPMPHSLVFISLDQTGKWLLATSFGDHKNSVHKLNADYLIDPIPAQVFASGGLNPHSIVTDKDNQFVFIPHLGTDEIKVHSFNSKLEKPLSESPAFFAVEKQYGPRHIVISQDNKFGYVITEMMGQVLVFSIDSKSGNLSLVQSISSLPIDTKLFQGKARPPTGSPDAVGFDDSNLIYSAEIKLTPNGRYLYTSDRTNNSLSGFEVDSKTGKLKYLFTIPTEQMPRGFGIDPDGQFLVATGQKSEYVSLYSIDPSTGELNLISRVPGGKGANWVTFAKQTL